MTISKQKAKRKLFNFDFDTNGAHVALVSKDQGGSACGYSVLVTKSTNSGIQPTDVVKVQKALEQITVTMSMEEFLRKFFDMWSSDAETLTKLLGFETEFEANKAERESSDGEYDWEKASVIKQLEKQDIAVKNVLGAVTSTYYGV